MEQLTHLKKYAIMAAIVAAVGFIYFMFIKQTSTPDLTTQAATQEIPGNADLLEALQTLNTLQLDGTIFKTDTFKWLQDTTIIPPKLKPEGRINPFAQIGVESGVLKLQSDYGTDKSGLSVVETQATTIKAPALNANMFGTSTSQTATTTTQTSTTTTKVTN